MPSPPPNARLPGFHSPGASFEQPFEMLLACHERVERSLDLLERLVLHVQQCGVDAAAQSAARDVVRYFDVAAPLHHQDEERHVFPRLNPVLGNALLQEHRQLTALWALVRTELIVWSRGTQGPKGDRHAHITPDCATFIALYRRHAATEEAEAFPAALAAVSPSELAGMGAEMSGRRQVARPSSTTEVP